MAVRVPVEDGSLTDLTAIAGQDVTAGQVNDAFRHASDDALAGILRYSYTCRLIDLAVLVGSSL